MTLLEFMKANRLTPGRMAERVGDVSPGHVRKLAYRERSPSLDLLERIQVATDGAVTANDFFERSRSAPARSAA